ncbi:MAG: hypothetical protein QM813_01225 [Verrucomicrobiota bacterium]
MTKFPKSGARGQRWSAARRFQGWLASWAQDRRRGRQHSVAPPPNAPVIVGGGYEDGASAPGWYDVFFDWTFEHGSYPVADMEVWLSLNGAPFSVYYVTPSNDPGWYYAAAANTPATFDFKVRYTDSNTGVVGPFSNVYQINIAP